MIMGDFYSKLRLVRVPNEQQRFVRDTCQADFVWDSQTRDLWLWAMNIACGEDNRFLPPFGDQQDFHDELWLFLTMGNTEAGNDSEKMYGYIQDSLNCLLGECLQKEYYELASNLSAIMESMEFIEKIGKRCI